MKKVRTKRPQLKLKSGLRDIKQANDIILNGEHEFKQEEQYLQLSASTTSKIDRARGNFNQLMALGNVGAPQVNRFVYSSFDARPINGRDINYRSVVTLANQTGNANFTVPDGYVFVLRTIKGHLISGFPSAGLAFDSIVGSLVVDGATDPYNALLPLLYPVNSITAGATTSTTSPYDIKEYNFYTVVDEGSTVTYHIDSTAPFNNRAIIFIFSGNLLAKTGVPANFEIGFDTEPMTTFKPVNKNTIYRQPKKLK